MRINDLIAFSIQSFKNRKSRVILTVLGVAVAIGIILFLVSLGYGLQRTVLERITTEDSILTLDVYAPDVEAIRLTNSSIEQIEQLENINYVSPQALVSGQILFEGLTSETAINIVDENFFRLAGLTVSRGDMLGDENPTGVIITPVVAELFDIELDEMMGKNLNLVFFMSRLPTEEGNTSTIEVVTLDKSFEVIGVVEEIESVNQIFVAYSSVNEMVFDEYQFIKVQVAGQSHLEAVREELISMGYLVSALSDVVEQANQIFTVIQIILAVFGVFSLFVAAIGLINTMTISLLERINEIGIMRAIGASSWDIKKIFLIESTLIGFLGGVVGILIGYATGLIFNLGLNILARALGGQPVNIFYIPFWFMFFIIFFSAVVGLISGVLPARKAGKLNALEALRYK